MRTLFGELPDPPAKRTNRKPRPSFVDPAGRPPAQRHSETSVAAAEAVAPLAKTYRAMVCEVIREAGAAGMTDEEIIDATGLPPSTARPRRIELVGLGMVRDSGTTRKTRSGRKAAVWVIVTKNSEAAGQ